MLEFQQDFFHFISKAWYKVKENPAQQPYIYSQAIRNYGLGIGKPIKTCSL